MNDDGDVAVVGCEYLTHGIIVANVRVNVPVMRQCSLQILTCPARACIVAKKVPTHVIVDADNSQTLAGELTRGLRADQTRRTCNDGNAHKLTEKGLTRVAHAHRPASARRHREVCRANASASSQSYMSRPGNH